MAIFVVAVASACGASDDADGSDSGIQEDLYHVEGSVLEDPCAVADEETIVEQWRLRKDDGWILTMLDVGRSITGEADGDTLTFEAFLSGTLDEGTVDECDYEETFTVEIEPYRTGFSGTVLDEVEFLCDNSACHVLYEVIGIPE